MSDPETPRPAPAWSEVHDETLRRWLIDQPVHGKLDWAIAAALLELDRLQQERAEHFCIKCHHRWTVASDQPVPPTEYCGECHREAQWLQQENERLRQAQTWQPIETAPKDTSVLVFNGYIDTATLWTDNAADGCGWVDYQGRMDKQPTHWMPLPAPPEGKE